MIVSAGLKERGKGGHRIMFKGVLKKGGGRTSRRDAGNMILEIHKDFSQL